MLTSAVCGSKIHERLAHFFIDIYNQYTYQITNYPNTDQTVLVTLYVQGDRLIAGDIHSTALNGFMHGLKMQQR